MVRRSIQASGALLTMWPRWGGHGLPGAPGRGLQQSVCDRSGWNSHDASRLGIDITPAQGVSLVVLGGRDVGNADAPVTEGDFSSCLFLHSREVFPAQGKQVACPSAVFFTC